MMIAALMFALAASSASASDGMEGMADMRPSPSVAGQPPRILPGFGSGGYDVEHAAPEAAAEFDNGVRLNNAFNEPEAIRAFIAAERIDPSCALCFWGEAAARAPTINYDISPDVAALAVAALDKASALAANLSPKGRGIIEAERARYVRQGDGWDVDYAGEAKAADALADRFPDDDALQVAAVNAELVAAGNGKPGSVTADNPYLPGAQARLESVLARSPDYTPALHFYLHLSEWQGHPEKTVAQAARLAALAPESGHLLHMASHIYFHTGDYQAAALANETAARADVDYVAKVQPPGGMNALPMHAHNLSYGLGSLLVSGDGRRALAFAREMQAGYAPDDITHVRSYLALGRYLPTAKVLAMPEPAPALAAGFYHFARGEALARDGRADGVAVEIAALERIQRDGQFPAQQKREGAMLEVARLTLVGRAAMLGKDWTAAAAAYRAAALFAEDKEPFADPPLWPWSPRRSLAEALLMSGDAAGAEQEARAALKLWPEDGVALQVLAGALAKRHDPAASSVLAQSKAAWRGPAELTAPAMI